MAVARTGSWLVLSASLAFASACAMGDPAHPDGPEVPDLGGAPGGGTAPAPATPDEVSVGATPSLRPSTILPGLAAIGVTANAFPSSIEKLKKDHRTTMMESFAKSLGVECTGCHASETKSDGEVRVKPDVSTPRKRVAFKMYTEFVQKLRFADGSPLYCDSCHQGKATFLDRSSEPALRRWMHENFVSKLVTTDGKAIACPTCHGTPFDRSFLDGWATVGP
ncbi:MAG: cytochrome c3 family protein [Polyangiaceae bacterium]